MTVVLLPSLTANHTLDLMMSISNITSFLMLSNSESKTFVICQDSGSLESTGVDHVWVKNLWFLGCGSNVFLSVKQLKLEDCTFQGQQDRGTELIIVNSSAIMEKTDFVSNTVGFCHIFGSPNYASAGQHIYAGGAVVLVTSNATFVNSKCKKNRAEAGGAIQALSANIEIINSEFVQNHVTTLKRNMQCPGPVIDGTQCFGGAITMIYSVLFINNSRFHNNTSDYGSAGALSIIASDVMINNSEFWNNKAIFGHGGAIDAETTYMTVRNCTFYNSSSF